MGILSKLFSRGVEKSAAGTPSAGLIPPLGGIQSATGLLVSQATAMTVSTVYTCVTIRSRDVARCAPSLYREAADGSRTPVTDHPVSRLLRRPNRQQTWFEFAQQMHAAWLLRGNAYAVILRDRRGRPAELVPVNPDGVMVLEAADGSVFYQVNRIGLSQMAVLRDLPMAIPADDMLHIRDLSFNILVGASRIGLARETIGVAQAQSQQAARFAGNSSNPSGILKTAKTLSDGAVKRLKAQWDAFTSGIQNTGKTAVLEEGLEWQRLQLTAADMDFIKSREFEVGEVARWFQMPLYKLGIMLPSQGQNGVQQQQSYVNDTIMPDLDMWEQRVARAFDLDLEGIGVDLDENRLLRADVQTRYNNYRVGILSGFMAPNEARRAENLAPVEGGEQVMFPVNMAAIGSNFTGTAPDGAGRPAEGELKALEVRQGPFEQKAWNPDQPRDANGRWVSGTGAFTSIAEALDAFSGMAADEARRAIDHALGGRTFAAFSKGGAAGFFPVAALGAIAQSKLSTTASVALLSQETAAKQARHHPEISGEEYRQLQSMLDAGEFRAETTNRVALLHHDGRWYAATLKTVQGKETLVLSFRRANERTVAQLRKRTTEI